MFIKLALKNVSKSFKDYGVYFFTLVFGVCVFYMFNSIYAQQELMSVTEGKHMAMQSLSLILSWISVFVSVVLGFLIIYANRFFIRRRKKELGIYMTLGMDKIKISTILVLETSLLAVSALVVGLASGVFLSQFMSLFTAKIFEADMTMFKFIFSHSAFWKCIMYFGIIFLVVIVFNTFTISRFSLIDLINGGRKNESLKVRNFSHSISIIVAAVICLSAAYYLILTNGMLNLNIYFTICLILGSVGTLLFFFGFSSFIITIIRKSKVTYFKNLNMFTLNQLSSKVNTNFVSMSVVCIILLLTIGVFACGYSMQHIFSTDLKASVPFDFSIHMKNPMGKKWAEDQVDLYSRLPDKLKKEAWFKDVEQMITFTHDDLNYDIFDVNISNDIKRLEDMPIAFMSEADYNAIRATKGLAPIELNGQYAIVSSSALFNDFAYQVINSNKAIEIGGTALRPYESLLEVHPHNSSTTLNFVVEENYLNGMMYATQILNINTIDEHKADKLEKLFDEYYLETEYDDRAMYYYRSKAMMYLSAISGKAIVSFLAIYLGLVFMITCAAILSIQQLTDAEDNKERYRLLGKLGADKKMLSKALFTQILTYFLLPLLLAIVHSYFGIMAANKVIMIVGNMDILETIMATSVFVIGIYGIYFMLTYIGSKNVVFRG